MVLQPLAPRHRTPLQALRFFSTAELVNALEQRKTGKISEALVKSELVILEELVASRSTPLAV
jgi:hypothetical protein